MADTLRSIIEDAKESLVELMDGGENALRKGHPSDDLISEVADGAVPVYNYDRISVLQSSSELWCDRPDLASDDSDIIDLIGFAIYEAVEQALYQYVRDLGEEPVQCTVDDCGGDDDHLDTDNETCIEHCDNSECDECQPEED